MIVVGVVVVGSPQEKRRRNVDERER